MVRLNFRGRIVRLALVVACVLFAGGFLAGANAQSPTPEQIQIFQGLPPDQQQAILDSLNRSGTTLGSEPKVFVPMTMRVVESSAEP